MVEPTPSLVVHLGAHRTASTRLQGDLSQLRRRNSLRGVAVLLPNEIRAGLTHAVNLAARLGPGVRLTARMLRHRVHRDWPPAARIIVSDENLLGRLDPPVCDPEGLYRAAPRLAALRLLLPGDRPGVVLAIRSYDTWYPSAWSRVVMRRPLPPLAELKRHWLVRKPLWPQLVDDILAAFGACTVVRYESFLTDRLALLRPILGDATPKGLKLGHAVTLPAIPGAALAEIAARRAAGETVDLALSKRIAAAHAGHPRAASPLSEAEAATMRAWYAEDVAAIAARPGVTLV